MPTIVLTMVPFWWYQCQCKTKLSLVSTFLCLLLRECCGMSSKLHLMLCTLLSVPDCMDRCCHLRCLWWIILQKSGSVMMRQLVEACPPLEVALYCAPLVVSYPLQAPLDMVLPIGTLQLWSFLGIFWRWYWKCHSTVVVGLTLFLPMFRTMAVGCPVILASNLSPPELLHRLGVLMVFYVLVLHKYCVAIS